MCVRWMGAQFLLGMVAFSREFLEWGHTFSDIEGKKIAAWVKGTYLQLAKRD